MRVMITGGGTGGHTSPAVAILEELQRRDPLLTAQWVGRRGGIEERVAERMGVPFRSVPVEGWPRTKSARRLWVAGKLAAGMGRAFLLLRGFRPQLVIGVGGYVSLPLGYMAERLSIPTFVHEQNKRLGMANRILAPRAARVFLSYPDTLGVYPQDRARVVGNPVRAGFTHPVSQEEARAKLGLDPALPVLLVTGGSQGARTLNQAMADAIGGFRPDSVQVLWMTGADGASAAREAAKAASVHVEVFAFIDDMVTACAASDLIVSRAGASSTAELAVLGKPAILVPYPHATDNHQEANARAFEEAGAAILLKDDECTGETILTHVQGLLADRTSLASMSAAASRLAKPGAAEAIAEEILSVAFEEAQSAQAPGGPSTSE